MATNYQRQPRCKLCKDDFFMNHLGICIGCKPEMYQDNDPIATLVRYAEMDKMSDAANGDLQKSVDCSAASIESSPL